MNDISFVPTEIELNSKIIDGCVEKLKSRYPFLKISSIGSSAMGKPLWCFSFGTGSNRVLYNGAHHANEWITATLLLKFTESLCNAYESGECILSESTAEIFSKNTLAIIPALNPDGIDLVTGLLNEGEYYDFARGAAENYPEFPFPEWWSANLQGIDLNLQYPAGWEQAKANLESRGIVSPAPSWYVGPAPLTAPESRALYDFTRSFMPELTISFHSQGEVIYWKYLEHEPAGAKQIGEKMAAMSGYTLDDTPIAAGFAGYKDWFVDCYDKPGFTVEVGLGINPLPLTDFDKIYKDNLGILLAGLLT